MGEKYCQFTTEEYTDIVSIYRNYVRKAKTQNLEVSEKYQE